MEEKNVQQTATEVFTVEEAQQLKPIMEQFMTAYAQNHDKEIDQWLPQALQSALDISLEEAQTMSAQIVATIEYDQELLQNLTESKSRGVTREAWVSKVVLEDVQDLPVEEQQQRLAEVYKGLEELNAPLLSGDSQE